MTEQIKLPTGSQPIDLESIPGQLGTAIVETMTTNDMKPEQKTTCTGEMTVKEAQILYSILLEIGMILSPSSESLMRAKNDGDTKANEFNNGMKCNAEDGQELLKKYTVSFSSIHYSCCVSNSGCTYIVKRRSS